MASTQNFQKKGDLKERHLQKKSAHQNHASQTAFVVVLCATPVVRVFVFDALEQDEYQQEKKR